MNKVTSRTTLLVAFILLIICCFFVITRMFFDNGNNIINTDIEPIKEMFLGLDGIGDCCWIMEHIGNNRYIGPSNFRITALIKLSQESVLNIKERYSFFEEKVHIDKRLTPKNSNTYYRNLDFEREILSGTFVGKVYIDFEDCNVYIVAENK